MKNSRIYWLFDDNSIAYIIGTPIFTKPIAFKFENHHSWNYNYNDFPINYYKI